MKIIFNLICILRFIGLISFFFMSYVSFFQKVANFIKIFHLLVLCSILMLTSILSYDYKRFHMFYPLHISNYFMFIWAFFLLNRFLSDFPLLFWVMCFIFVSKKLYCGFINSDFLLYKYFIGFLSVIFFLWYASLILNFQLLSTFIFLKKIMKVFSVWIYL